MLSWGLCLGLATLFVAPVFAGRKLEAWICGLFIADGTLCIGSGIGYVLANQIEWPTRCSVRWRWGLGILAGAIILPPATALLAVFFKHVEHVAS